MKINFGYKHRFGKSKLRQITDGMPKIELGIWFRKSEIVKKFNKNVDNKISVELCNNYQIGFNLLVIKIWFEIVFI